MIDNKKWSEIYNKHSKRMFGVCKRYVNDVSLAEDLMHEGFIVAMQKQNTFSGFGSFEGWLRTIMVNTSLMYLRNNKNKYLVSEIEISDNTSAITDMTSTYDIKSKIINTDFTQQELLEVVEGIPEHHKLVFNMYVIDNFSHKEISKTLNISANTSKSHLLRARKKIQELLYIKATEKEENKDKKSIFIWFLLLGNCVDSIYAKSFSSFELSTLNFFDIDQIIKEKNLPDKMTKGYIFGISLQKHVYLTITTLFFLAAFLYFYNKENTINTKKTETNKVTDLKEKIINKRSIKERLHKESLKINRKNEIIASKKKGLSSQTDKDLLTTANAITTQEEKKSTKISNQSKKTLQTKNNTKNHVVIKKIIDTVYVYK